MKGVASRVKDGGFQVQNLPLSNSMTLCKPLEPEFSLLQNGVIVLILWVGVRTEGDDAACKEPAHTMSGPTGQWLVTRHGCPLPIASTSL